MKRKVSDIDEEESRFVLIPYMNHNCAVTFAFEEVTAAATSNSKKFKFWLSSNIHIT